MKDMGVVLRNGEEILGDGVCKKVLLQISGIEIKEDYLSLELGNTYLSFGIQWLENWVL